MTKKYIEIKGKPYHIPNSWDALSPSQFVFLAGLLQQYAAGLLSMSDVRLRYVIHVLGVDMSYVPRRHSKTIAQNLYVLLSQITFIFEIHYPAGVWNSLSPEVRALARKTEPADLPDSPEVRILRRIEYSFGIDACFAAQLLPTIEIEGNSYRGYSVNTQFDELSCSLSAAQYTDASERLSDIGKNPAKLPLLAAILYCPDGYSSTRAHALASVFGDLDKATLEAVALNFQAFILFLFTRTHFSMLWKKDAPDAPAPGKFSVGLRDGIYNLSEEGYGDIDTVGNMPVVDYLNILYKKKIDAVRTLHDADVKVADIAGKLSLDIKTVNEIIK